MTKSLNYYSAWLNENNFARECFAANGITLDYKKERELNDVVGYLQRSVSRNSIGQLEAKLSRYDELLRELYNLAKAAQEKTERLTKAN